MSYNCSINDDAHAANAELEDKLVGAVYATFARRPVVTSQRLFIRLIARTAFLPLAVGK